MQHSFHIPVMGLAFTVDTPIRVAHLGISSVMSIGDDFLIEKVSKYYGEKHGINVPTFDRKDREARWNIIATYLNLVQNLVNTRHQEHISKLLADEQYRLDFFEMLPKGINWNAVWDEKKTLLTPRKLEEWAKAQFKPGSMDVNIMTKLDRKNSIDGEVLPVEYNDAHAALKGFAVSNLSSSLVLSAGMNPSLFNYMQQFDDFFPDQNGQFKKKIVIKVSDYRSALVQGKMLAKKGLWVSEFRIESGLNCGGHAFPSQGFLLGPILDEFKQKRQEIYNELFAIWHNALPFEKQSDKNGAPTLKISAQGGVGTSDEHEFLLSHYGVDSVGWGSPFLLVPEAVSIDNDTLQKLSVAREDDLYLSEASPLGFPFHNLKNSSKRFDQQRRVSMGRPGSPCTKKYLKLGVTEFSEEPLCTASSVYMKKALEKLNSSQLTDEQKEARRQQIFEKECLCCGLAMPFLVDKPIEKKIEGKGVSVCPGPNIAYFEGVLKLKDMVMHIYGKKNLIARTDRPNMFIKEIQLYVDYLGEKVSAYFQEPNDKTKTYLAAFIDNMNDGLEYYQNLFIQADKMYLSESLDSFYKTLNKFKIQIGLATNLQLI